MAVTTSVPAVPEQPDGRSDPAASATAVFAVEGMHCGACVRRVTNALQTVPGIQINSVEVGSAKLAFNPDATTPEEITAAVNGIGFTAKVAA